MPRAEGSVPCCGYKDPEASAAWAGWGFRGWPLFTVVFSPSRQPVVFLRGHAGRPRRDASEDERLQLLGVLPQPAADAAPPPQAARGRPPRSAALGQLELGRLQPGAAGPGGAEALGHRARPAGAEEEQLAEEHQEGDDERGPDVSWGENVLRLSHSQVRGVGHLFSQNYCPHQMSSPLIKNAGPSINFIVTNGDFSNTLSHQKP